MKNQALLLALAGLIVLSSIILLQKPLTLSSQNQLSSLEENSLVSVQGNIIKQYSYGKDYLITLDNNISCIFSSLPKSKNKVEVIGLVDKYENSVRVRALEVTYSDS